MNNLIYNLWEIAPHLNDIDSNCSSSCSLQGHNLHAQAMGFVHAFGFIFFFALKEIFLILIIKGEKLHTKVMQNIYICIRYHTLHYANTGFGQVTRKVLLSNTGRIKPIYEYRHRRRTHYCGGRARQNEPE